MVQAYVQYPSGERMPLKELKAFKRVFVQKGKKATVHFSIPLAELQKWDSNQKEWILHPGTYTIILGGSSADARLKAAVNLKKGN